MDDFRLSPPGTRVDNDLVISDVEMLGIRFVPTLTSNSLNVQVRYKQFVISFESLPIELQQHLKQIAMERVSKQLESEKSRYSNGEADV